MTRLWDWLGKHIWPWSSIQRWKTRYDSYRQFAESFLGFLAKEVDCDRRVDRWNRFYHGPAALALPPELLNALGRPEQAYTGVAPIWAKGAEAATEGLEASPLVAWLASNGWPGLGLGSESERRPGSP